MQLSFLYSTCLPVYSSSRTKKRSRIKSTRVFEKPLSMNMKFMFGVTWNKNLFRSNFEKKIPHNHLSMSIGRREQAAAGLGPHYGLPGRNSIVWAPWGLSFLCSDSVSVLSGFSWCREDEEVLFSPYVSKENNFQKFSSPITSGNSLVHLSRGDFACGTKVIPMTFNLQNLS